PGHRLGITLVLTHSSENQASDCCLGHKNQLIPLHVLASYRRQGPETGCTSRVGDSVFLPFPKNKSLCAPPTAQWALDLMQKLDKKKPKALAVHAGKQNRSKGPKGKKQRKLQQ
uniref:Chemokine interleukin-8-like domain-containing protein n=1 Tax=Pelusios castaneus TaxID=367368 RepID=A0A8C8VG72_9SAUR